MEKNMIYAIATHSFLMTVEFDEDWEMQDLTILDTDHHYGIAVIDDSRIIAVKRKENKKESPQLTMYDLKAADKKVSTIPLAGEAGDVHQIACANGGIYMANTMYNSVMFQSLDGKKHHNYSFKNVSRDWNHPNSVYPCGDQVFVFLHNRGLKDSQLAILRHDLSKGFELEHLKSLWYRKGHNIYITDNRLYYNASDKGKFVVVDLEKERVAETLSFPGHVKGMSSTSDHFVIGFSDHTSRETRFGSCGHLAVIDKQFLSVKSIINMNFSCLPGPIGNINEIRCLSEKELTQSNPHSLDIDWPSIRLSKNDCWYQIKTKLSGPVWTAKRVAEWSAKTKRYKSRI